MPVKKHNILYVTWHFIQVSLTDNLKACVSLFKYVFTPLLFIFGSCSLVNYTVFAEDLKKHILISLGKKKVHQWI